MRSTRKVGWLVGDVTGHGSRMLTSCKAVAQRGRLDNSLIGKLLVGGRNDGEARGLISSRHAGGLGGELRHGIFIGTVPFGRLLVKSSFDNVSLLLSN